MGMPTDIGIVDLGMGFPYTSIEEKKAAYDFFKANLKDKQSLEEFEIAMRNSLVGIGATLSDEDGYCVIKDILPGGPLDLSRDVKTGDTYPAGSTFAPCTKACAGCISTASTPAPPSGANSRSPIRLSMHRAWSSAARKPALNWCRKTTAPTRAPA